MSNEHITDEQIVAAARALNKLAAEAGNVNEADQWALYGNSFIADAAVILRAALADLRPAAQPVGKPVASIYISPNGDREFDDWKCALPVGRNILYTTPQPVAVPDRVPMTDEDAKKLLNRSDLLDMFLHIGWYSAPRKNFDQNALLLLRAIEAHHGITTPKADK